MCVVVPGSPPHKKVNVIPLTTSRAAVEPVVRDFLRRIKKDADASTSTELYADGIGLDSLETAELSALLEDEFGTDPFSTAAELPQTLGEVLDFYGPAAASA